MLADIKNGYDDISDIASLSMTENDPTKRKTSVSFIEEKDNMMNELVWSFVRQANTEFFKYNLSHFEPIQFSKYDVGGHYDWHTDSHRKISASEDRKLSLTMSLTDNTTYEGGLLQFYNGGRPHTGKDVSVNDVNKVGTVIVFDSGDWHKVTPVTKGVRYSIVCWTIGPNFI